MLYSVHKYIYSRFILSLLIAGILTLTPLIVPRIFADSVTIDDRAKVLDASQVQAEAAKLPYAMLIYTTRTFQGDQDALNQATRDRLPNQDAVDIGIDVTRRHLSIQSGTNVPLSDSQASDAVDAFRSNFNNGDYTGATIAAIDSLLNAFGVGGTAGSSSGTGGSDNGTTFPDNGVTSPQIDVGTAGDSSAAIGVVVVIVIGLFLLIMVAVVLGRKERSKDDDPPDDNRSGDSRSRNFSRGVLYGGILEESWHRSRAENTFNSGFSSNDIGGAGGNFGGDFGGGAGGSFGGGNTGGGAGGSF